MNGGHPWKAAVKRDEHVERLGLANLANDYAAGAHTQRLLHKAAHRNFADAFEVRLPALHAHDVPCGNIEFEDFLDRHDSFARVDGRAEATDHRRFACAYAPGDDDVEPCFYARVEEVGSLLREGP